MTPEECLVRLEFLGFTSIVQALREQPGDPDALSDAATLLSLLYLRSGSEQIVEAWIVLADYEVAVMAEAN